MFLIFHQASLKINLKHDVQGCLYLEPITTPLPKNKAGCETPLLPLGYAVWLSQTVKLAVILRLKGNPLRRTIVLFFGSRKRCKGTQLMPYSRFQWLSSAGPLHQDFQWLAWKGIQKMDLQNCSSTGTTHLSITCQICYQLVSVS